MNDAQIKILHIHAVNEISLMKLKNIEVGVDIHFGLDSKRLHITVFDHNGDNMSVNFYDHSSFNNNIIKLSVALDNIRKDNFEMWCKK